MKLFTKHLQLLMVILLLAVASQALAQTTLFTEGWESASVGMTPPAGWAVDTFTYGNWTSWTASGSYPSAMPFEGTRMTVFDSWDAAVGYQNRLKRITSINTIGFTNITVDFAEYDQNVFSNGDGITIQWSTNGTTWTSAGTNWSNFSNTPGWVINTQALPAGAANQATLYVAFLFTSQYGYDVYLDLCHVKGLQTGTVTGNVKDFLTNFPLAGVAIFCGGVGPVLSNAAGVYTLNNVPYGTQLLTATFPGYVAYSALVNVGGKSTTTYNFFMYPIPSVLTGIVTDCATNMPLVGVKLVINGQTGYSVQGGLYTINIYNAGNFPMTPTKQGYHDTVISVIIPPGTTVNKNFCMGVPANPPSQPFPAGLNASQTAVNLSWGIPTGNYELLYDDGLQDTNTVWASANNMNAMKFTPLAYPVQEVGGSIDIGQPYNYPNGTTLAQLIPFTMQVYDATGSGGSPGNPVGNSVTVTPASFGWNSFNISGVNITNGDFYLVMKQIGTPPYACHLAVDTSSNQLRSWQKFVNKTAVWLPASGNFMIRAVVNGAGGPPEHPGAVTGYQVYRLFVQDQGNPSQWVPVAAPVTHSTVDPSWPALPDSCFMWAVKAHYGGTRWSPAILSNALCKNHSVNVTVNVTPTCASTPLAGSAVSLTSLPPYAGLFSYNGSSNSGGTVGFPEVQKSPYLLSVSRPGYDTYNQNVSVYANHIYNVALLQTKYPASNATINNRSLFMHWTPPGPHIFALNEDFSGGLATNAWVNPTGYWQIATTGNPGNCAEYPWTTYQTNYSTTLTSKSITGMGAPDFKLYWDIFLSDYAGDGNEQLDVEIQLGGAGAWTSLKHYANTGSISWQTDSASLAVYTNGTFKIRFNAHGVDAFNINNWDVDNVKVVSNIPDPKPCILAYNVYLNGVMDGTSTDTTYTVPGTHCVYGTTYTACVKVVYGSGTSAPACTTPFVSRWLCPPTNFAGQALEATAYLTWSKPACGGQLINYIFDNGVAWNAVSINAGYNIQMGNYFPLPATTAGLVMGFDIWFSQYSTWTAQSCVVSIFNAAHVLIGQSDPFINTAATWPSGSWVHATVTNGVAFTGPFYGMIDYYSAAAPIRNGMGLDGTTTTYDPNGLGWAIYNGVWATVVSTFGYPAPETWMERVTCFVYGKDKAGELVTYGPAPKDNNVTPVPAAVNFASAERMSVPVGDPTPMSPNVVTLQGYNITRDGVPLPYINDPNRLYYYDNNLNPGVYHYCITSYWDVTPVLPLHDNSAPVCGVTVTINYGRPLPFCENWDNGTLGFNNWVSAGNWSCSSGFGNPAPSADFAWQPSLNNYNDTLQSATFSAGPYSCAKIYLDYDYKLLDRNHTGAEFLTVEQLKDGAWTKVDEYSNNGDVNWTSKHFELKQTMGKAFKVRFRAHGAHSLDILHWYVDNICLYAVCNRPLTLTYTESHNTVNLSWLVPSCKASGPPAHWIHWDDGTNSDAIGTGGAVVFDIASRWTPDQIASLSGGSITKISFYPAGSGTATYRARIWQGANAATMVVDQNIASVTLDQWNTVTLTTPSLIDVSKELWFGVNVNASAGYPAGVDAGPAIDGFGDMMYYQGAWATLISLNPALDFNWNLQAYVETVKGATMPVALPQPTPAPASTGTFAASGHVANGVNAIFNKGGNDPQGASIIMGYNVYRTDSTANMATSHKINSTLVTGLTYTDVIPLVGWGNYKYNVTAVMNDSITNTFLCESPKSDTINVQFPHVGISEIGNGQIMVYPNPATDNVNVKSDFTVTSIEVMNYTGQTVYRNTSVNSKTTQFNVTNLQAGIYFVKVATDQGARTLKITVTR